MIEIIESREQITPAWLSDTLAAAGVKTTVTEVEIEPIVAGYYGSSSRLTPRYEEDDESLPNSLFLKMATEHQSAREKAAQGGMYRYEVGFYRDLAGQVNIATPRCYAAEISQDNSAFVLLLEDAAPFVQVDQLQGLNLAQAKLVPATPSNTHAPGICYTTTYISAGRRAMPHPAGRRRHLIYCKPHHRAAAPNAPSRHTPPAFAILHPTPPGRRAQQGNGRAIV